MNTFNLNSKGTGIVVADYKDPGIDIFRDNPLIEALPPLPTDDEMMASLKFRPPLGGVGDQAGTAMERKTKLAALRTLILPQQRHLDLAALIHQMIRFGYIGRSVDGLSPLGANIPDSKVLIGSAGIGKTTTVKKVLSAFSRVIYHPKFDLYQIPYLYVETPANGKSLKGLCYAILARIDELIPSANYLALYGSHRRTDADTLRDNVARILRLHCVGLLVCDEIQNVLNAKKADTKLISELVAACNSMNIPLLFIGTNDAAQVFDNHLHAARRAAGALTVWNPLKYSETSGRNDSEFENLIKVLLKFQITRKPIEQTQEFTRAMFYYTQGITDIVIKLFIDAQALAIDDNSEEISILHLEQSYREKMTPVHTIMDSLRRGRLNELQAFGDVITIAKNQSTFLQEPLAQASSLSGSLQETAVARKAKTKATTIAPPFNERLVSGDTFLNKVG